MSYDKYYENLYRDGKLNNRFVTYLSAIDMENSLLNRDAFKNNPIADICSNYACRSKIFYDAINAPLGFLNDDVQVIYDYTLSHIESILEKPNQNIIKEQKLIAKEKVKQLEPKTFNWLANKPGISIKEKMAYVNKISSPVKRYTYNIKENQVVLAFYKDIARLLNSKISFYENNADLFGQSNEELYALKSKLNKIKYKLRNEFDEVVEKDYSTPNNALLGNKDYSAIWKSYVELKQANIDYTDSFDRYVKSFKAMFITLLLNKYDFVEQSLSYDEIDQCILYKIEDEILKEIIIRDGFTIVIKEYSLDGVAKETNETKYAINFIELETESLGGIPFKLVVNNEEIGEFTADNLGFKLAFDDICKHLSLEIGDRTIEEIHKVDLDLLSLNSFDNRAYPLSKPITATFDKDFYENKNIYIANSAIIELNDYKNPHFLPYLRLLSKKSNDFNKSTVIYDISDNYDEFSSAELRRNISSVFSKSYPVWRSILLGESLDNKENVEYVVDMCGSSKSVVVSRLERKNDRFVHCGAVEAPIYLQNFNEYDFLSFYLSQYEREYNVLFPEEVKNSFIRSGALNKVLQKEQDNAVLVYGDSEHHEYFIIKFDKNIFLDACLKFIGTAKQIVEHYDETKTVFIVPNFLKELAAKYDTFVCNEYLRKGSKIISKRLENGEVCWYERLPKLSLEVIKNGMFDSLMLVENKECENIIGRSITIDIPEEFTLTKGEANYILPLNKSFVGDENESFIAKAEDKTFPLGEDVKVKLKLTYCFGAENSYLLKLVPIESAPFKEIEIKWEKEEGSNVFYSPKIIDNILTNDDIDKEIEVEIPKYKERLNKSMDQVKRGSYIYTARDGRIYDNLKSARKNLSVLANKKQRLIATNKVSKNALDQIFDSSLLDDTDILIDYYEENSADKLDYLKKMINLDDTLVGLSLDKDLFINNELHYNYGCYGRYLNSNPEDKRIIDMAYNDLLSIVSENNYFQKRKIRIFLEKFTSVTVGNHLAIKQMSLINNRFIHLLMNVIVDVLKELTKFNWYQEDIEEAYGNNRFENIYMIRHCYEILIGMLYCRDDISFTDLRPNGICSKQLLFYIKELNCILMSLNGIEDMEKKLKTKYVMNVEVPNNLHKMWDVAYILILCLSGDERANYITIGEKE